MQQQPINVSGKLEELEAFQYDGTYHSAVIIRDWARAHGARMVIENYVPIIQTPDGQKNIGAMDWVIRVSNRFHVFTNTSFPDIFSRLD